MKDGGEGGGSRSDSVDKVSRTDGIDSRAFFAVKHAYCKYRAKHDVGGSPERLKS